MNLLFNIFKKVFNIKTKVHVKLKNLTENTTETFSGTCKITENEYVYIDKETTYILIKNEESLTFIRENTKMQHTMIFNPKMITTSEYYLKEMHTSLEFNIKTTNLKITDKKFIINYQILETTNEYEYIIEMSDIK